MGAQGAPSHDSCLAFGPFVVDVRRRLLLHDQQPVALNSKTFDVLAVLIEHRDRIVTKDELLELAWANVIVQESNLVRQVSMLRRALGQRPDQHDYIVTVPGRGYRFVADVIERPCAPEHHVATAPPLPAAVEPPPEPIVTTPPPAEAVPVVVAVSAARPYLRAIVGMAAVMFTLLATGVFLMTRRTAVPVERWPARRVQVQPATFEAGVPREPAWSPDGRQLAFTSDKAGNADIWVQTLDSPEPRAVTTHPDKDGEPSWSPDGQRIAFRSERDGGGIYVVSANGGEPRRVLAFGHRPRWSPDGRLILVSQQSVRVGTEGLAVVDPDTGASRPVLAALVSPFVAQLGGAIDANWTPDGRVSIWGRHPRDGWVFVTATLDGQRLVRTTPPADVQQEIDRGLRLRRFVWAPSGSALFFEGTLQGAASIWRVAVDPATHAWVGPLDRLTDGTSDDGDIAVAPDGTLAFTVRTSQTRLWALPREGAAPRTASSGRPITSSGVDELDADAAADGALLAYRAMRAGRQEVRMRVVATGQERVLLTSATLTRTNPMWSRDGKSLAYAVSPRDPGTTDDGRAVGVVSADGGGERLYQTTPETRFVPTDWSKSGNVILGWCRTPRMRSVGTCLFSLSTAEPPAERVRPIASDDAYNLFCQRFSADERWIAFVGLSTSGPTRSRIFVQSAAGGAWLPLTDGTSFVDKPRWTPDGEAVYYISDRDGFLNVWAQRFDPRLGRPLGDAQRVTAFVSEAEMIPAAFGPLQMAVTSKTLFLPIRQTTGGIWLLKGLGR